MRQYLPFAAVCRRFQLGLIRMVTSRHPGKQISHVAESTTQPVVTQAERIPRHRLQGGFLISPETALEWASKLENKPVTKINVAWKTIDLRSKRFRRGYLGMDPSQIPQFREGEREAIARKMLEEELKALLYMLPSWIDDIVVCVTDNVP
ncbi:hypothetical protein EV421DRAFT_2022964 [Armillaria borealis]|uniref:Uncharacterized protein n=1 Tax=Armillaria borealis TaxID=47425 RepID=A0AA39J403_9AGAR|nr:hypothetical protein EV421DRAFT_2022964 [Armillaria borealis]